MSWIIDRLSWGATADELQADHPGLCEGQIELFVVLEPARVLGIALTNQETSNDQMEPFAERKVSRALEREVWQAPPHYWIELLRMVAGLEKQPRRLFQGVAAWDDDSSSDAAPARDRLHTRYDWLIKRGEKPNDTGG